MFNSMMYSIKRALRDKELMFSSILIAILMGTVMFFMTDSIMDQVNDGDFNIYAAVVVEEGAQNMFLDTLVQIDMFVLEFVDMEAALYLLENNEINGIYVISATAEPRLYVPASFFSQRVMQMVLDEYIMNTRIFTEIAMNNPQYLETAMMSMLDRDTVLAEMEIAENVIDMMQMFMIMFVTTGALSGIFVGFERALLLNSDGTIGSRRLVSSFGKMKMLLADLFGATMVVLLITAIIWAYFALVLGVELQVNLALAGLSFLITGLFGLSFGAFFGLVAPGKRKAREQFLNVIYMGMIMLGFFGSQMRMPIIRTINEFNPLMILIDAIMALSLGSYNRYIGFMITMSALTVVMLVGTIIATRRNRDVDAK